MRPQLNGDTLGGRMLGLRVRLPGQRTTFLALPYDEYLVSAGARLGRRRHAAGLRSYFQGSGIDDRGDALEWFLSKQPAIGSTVEITVVETPNWTIPC
jgi:hypothetical protein